MSKKTSFEEALATLSNMAQQVESGELSLEASIDIYEKSQALIQICQGHLSEAEKTVQKLIQKEVSPAGDTLFDLEPFI